MQAIEHPGKSVYHMELILRSNAKCSEILVYLYCDQVQEGRKEVLLL